MQSWSSNPVLSHLQSLTLNLCSHSSTWEPLRPHKTFLAGPGPLAPAPRERGASCPRVNSAEPSALSSVCPSST